MKGEFCCSKSELCYVHLVKSGIEISEARKIIEMRDLTPKLNIKNSTQENYGYGRTNITKLEE